MNNEYKTMFSKVRSVHSENPYKMEVIMNNKQKHRIPKKPILAVAAIAIALLLSVTAYALVTLLSPAEVAREMGYNALAQAFENGEGTLINESITSEGFIFTLHGMATGENLLSFYEEAEDGKSVLVLSVRRENGKPMDFFNPDTVIGDTYFAYCVVFDGFAPWQISSRTIGGTGGSLFEKDGVLYVMLDCTNFEIFADRNPTFAVWDSAQASFAPSAEVFQMKADGSIDWADGMQAPRAMFILPLDPSKADPARVAQLIDALENPPAYEDTGDSFEWSEELGRDGGVMRQRRGDDRAEYPFRAGEAWSEVTREE